MTCSALSDIAAALKQMEFSRCLGPWSSDNHGKVSWCRRRVFSCDLLAYPDFIRQTHFAWHSKQVKSKAKNYFSGTVTEPSMSSGSPALIWWVHPTIGRLYSNAALAPSTWHLSPRTLPCSRRGRESSRRNNETRFILLLCIGGFSNNYFEQKELTSLCSKNETQAAEIRKQFRLCQPWAVCGS